MNLYLHESGDFGFSFDKPFRKGGSSRYATFSFLLIPEQLVHYPKRIVRKLYRKRRQSANLEIKGRDLTPEEKAYFSDQTAELLASRPEINFFSITLKKKTVKKPLQRDMARLFRSIPRMGLMEKIKDANSITFIPSNRAVRMRGENCFSDSIQAELWFGQNSNTVIENSPKESIRELNLQFTDWLGHIIWKKYEDDDTVAYDILKKEADLTPWWETLSAQW